MKITHPIMIILAGITITSSVHTQEYIRLDQNHVVYDVDVIVFARRLAQPSIETFNNAPLVKSEDVRVLLPWNQKFPLFVYPEPEPESEQEKSEGEWQVPIEEQPKLADVLNWMLLVNNTGHPVINRLEVNPNIKPLMHQKWRQPASPFLQPEYVEMSQLNTNDSSTINEGMISALFPTTETYADYSIDGQVAFSKQRFTHLHVKMNLFRINADGEQIIHKIVQQKRIELGEWQYFDHQQFGILAKVTAVKIPAADSSGE